MEGPSESTELPFHVTEASRSCQHLHVEESTVGSEAHAELAQDHFDDGRSTARADNDGRSGSPGCSEHSSSLSKALSKLQRKRSHADHTQTESLGQEERLEISAADSVGKRLCTSSYFTLPEAADDV